MIAGAVVGPRRNRLRAAIANGDGALPRDLAVQLRHPLLVASWRVRFALLAGLLFEMTAKPELRADIVVTGGALLVGLAWSIPLWSTGTELRS